MSKKIIILGAGVAGLTVAHELIHQKPKHYEIHIYEKNDIVGGMARSHYKIRNGTKLPTEYCWRIYGPNYDNLKHILKQIPLQNNPTKTVHDNLVAIREFLISDQQMIFRMNNRPTTLFKLRNAFSKIPFREKFNVLKKIIYCFMISTIRLNSLDNKTWKNFIDPNNSLCHDMRKYIIDILGPFLGADINQVNVPSVVKTLESFHFFNAPICVMNAPTNEAWFDHWKNHLESKGVIFHLNKLVTNIQFEKNRVTRIIIENNEFVSGDYFFCSLPIEAMASLFPFSKLRQLSKNSRQLMVGIQLYFDKKISLPMNHTALYIPDSPWQLVIEPQGAIWEKCWADIGDIWSLGLCDSVRPGLLIKKPFVYCSHEEIKQEVWYELLNSNFGNFFKNVRISDYHVWDSYVYNGVKLETCEPKFSTNKDTYFLRPLNQTQFENLFFAAGYTQTDTDMFEMESAAESGKRAAQILEPNVKVITCERPRIFYFYRLLDFILFKWNIYEKFPITLFLLGLPLMVLTPLVYCFNLFKRVLSKCHVK